MTHSTPYQLGVDPTAGTHTLNLCGEVGAAYIYVINAELGVVYEPGGVAPELPTPPVVMSAERGLWK